MTVDDLHNLAASMDVRLDLCESGSVHGCYADERQRLVHIEGWDGSDKMIACAMHELGHIACRHVRTDRDLSEPLETEAEAWEWAFKNGASTAPEIREFAVWAMNTYYYTFRSDTTSLSTYWIGYDPRKATDGGPLGRASEWFFDNIA